jgi:hypothetical protein
MVNTKVIRTLLETQTWIAPLFCFALVSGLHDIPILLFSLDSNGTEPDGLQRWTLDASGGCCGCGAVNTHTYYLVPSSTTE